MSNTTKIQKSNMRQSKEDKLHIIAYRALFLRFHHTHRTGCVLVISLNKKKMNEERRKKMKCLWNIFFSRFEEHKIISEQKRKILYLSQYLLILMVVFDSNVECFVYHHYHRRCRCYCLHQPSHPHDDNNNNNNTYIRIREHTHQISIACTKCVHM